MSIYLLPELSEKSHDQKLFPLLANGQDEDFLLNDPLFPRFIHLSGKSRPIFSGGIISAQEIELIAQGISRAIFERHQGKSLLIVAVLEGARPFAGLVEKHLRRLEREGTLQLHFSSLKISSYKSGRTATRHEIVIPLTDQAGGRMDDLSCYDTIVIIDDLIDSGETIHWLASKYLAPFGVGEIEAYFMLEKKVQRSAQSRREIDLITPVIGKMVPDEWLVGFGLDLALPNPGSKKEGLHLFRGVLPGGIYAFNESIEKELFQVSRKGHENIVDQLGVYISDR